MSGYGFQYILTFMMLLYFYSSISALVSVIRGVSIHDCASALRKLGLELRFIVVYLLYLGSEVSSYVVTFQISVSVSYAILYKNMMVIFKK